MSCIVDPLGINEETLDLSNNELWEELKTAGKNNLLPNSRSLRKIIWGVATDDRFLEYAKNSLYYATNSQGDITLESFLKIANHGSIENGQQKEKLRNTILDHVGSLPMSYQEALYKIVNFNKAYEESSDFILSFEEFGDQDRNVKLVVKDNTVQNRAELQKRVKKRGLNDLIRYLLAKLGIAVTTNTKNDFSMLSTYDVEENAEGLKELITLSQTDEAAVSESLTLNVGKLIVVALREHPLVKRLVEQLKKEVATKFIEDNNFDNMPLLTAYLELNPNTLEGRVTDAEGNVQLENMSEDDYYDFAAFLIGNALNNNTSLHRNIKIKREKETNNNKINWEWKKFFTSSEQWKGLSKAVLNLIKRVIKAAKNIFKKGELKKFKKALKEAEEISKDIAEGFKKGDYFEKMLDSLDTMEEEGDNFSFEKEEAKHVKLWQRNRAVADRTLFFLNKILSSIKGLDSSWYKTLQLDLISVIGTYDTHSHASGVVMAQAANQVLIRALEMLKSNFINVSKKMENINFADLADFIEKSGDHARHIMESLIYLLNASLIINEIKLNIVRDPNTNLDFYRDSEDATTGDFLIKVVDNLRNERYINLTKEINDFQKLYLDATLKNATAKRQEFVLGIMKHIIGSNLIDRARRVLHAGFWGLRTTEASSSEAEEGVIPLEDIIRNATNDIGWFHRWFSSMSNNPDVMGQALDKLVKAAKFVGNKNFLEERTEVLNMYASLKGDRFKVEIEDPNHPGKKIIKRVNPEDLYEKYEDNTYSGFTIAYIETEVDDPDHPGKKKIRKIGVSYGKWYDDFEEMQKQALEEFEELCGGKHKLYRLSDALRSALWASFFNKKFKEWHKAHSLTRKLKNPKNNKTYTINVPNPKLYGNDAYEKLDEASKEYLDKWLDWKERVDRTYLPPGSTVKFKVPQIYGTRVNEMYNRKLIGEGLISRFRNTLGRRICDLFVKHSNETDYGSELTVNEQTSLYNEAAYHDAKIERIPLFYINRLKKNERHRLSTDLIGASLAYAAMATLFKQLDAVKNAIGLSMELMKARVIHTKEGDKKVDEGTSNMYKTAALYVSKELYGLNYGVHLSSSMVTFNKIVQFFTHMATRMFLGGNMKGGMANFIMGITEVTKEALTGEFFTRKDLGSAFKEYFGLLHGSASENNLLIDSFRQLKRNKVNLYAEYFDIFGDAIGEHRKYDFRNPKLEALKKADLVWHNAFMPYGTGDHAMQLLPFIALGKATKLYYINDKGNIVTTNAYDIYEVTKEGSLYVLRAKLNGDDYRYVKNVLNIQRVKEGKKKIEEIDLLLEDIKDLQSGFKIIDENKYKLIMDEANIEKIYNDPESLHNRLSILKLTNLRQTIEQSIENDTWSAADEQSLKLRGREIGNRLHGVYNSLDKTMFQSTVLGAMITSMRGYVLGMIERRFGDDKYSIALGKDVEGNLVTSLKAFKTLWTHGVKTWTLLNLLPFTGKAKEVATSLGFSDNQFMNMRRTFLDYATIGLLYFVTALISGFRGYSDSDDFDDEGGWGWDLLYYFLVRLNQEQSAFNNPVTFIKKEGPTVLSVYGAGMSAMKDIVDIVDGFFFEDDYSTGKYAGLNKGVVRFKRKLPLLRDIMSLWDNNPKEAAESYLLFRSRGGR